MKAFGYTTPGPLDRDDALVEFEIDEPIASGHDLLVRVAAVSVNPVDVKVRANRPPLTEGPAVLGWDAAGVVEAVGEEVSRFEVGDAVYYAGDVTRPGTNAEFNLVDERIVGHKPSSLSNAEAAALPLTTLTAWEMLFDRLNVNHSVPGVATPSVLIVGGAGGVGSIAIQLLDALTDLTVIATASRPETKAWATELGAHHVIDHTQPLGAELESHGLAAPGFVFCTTHVQQHWASIADVLAPQGRFGFIDEGSGLDIMLFRPKSQSVHHELMFTRPMFATGDMVRQGEILDEAAALADAGRIRSTLTDTFGTINVANLRRAHAMIETNRARGKLVLEGF